MLKKSYMINQEFCSVKRYLNYFFSTKSVKLEEVSRVKPGPVKKTNLSDDRQEYIPEYKEEM